jgi:hypothetical protein
MTTLCGVWNAAFVAFLLDEADRRSQRHNQYPQMQYLKSSL